MLKSFKKALSNSFGIFGMSPLSSLTHLQYFQFSGSSIKEEGKFILETIDNEQELSKNRIDKYLQDKFDLKWNMVQSLFRKKKVKIYSKETDSMIIDPGYYLLKGDIIYYPKPIYENLNNRENRPQEQNEKEPKLDEKCLEIFKYMILYENEDFILVNKLPNISSQGGAEVKLNLYFLLNNYFVWKKAKLETDLDNYTGIVHRLDKNTTGIMALAKQRTFAHEFSRLLRKRKNITKTYLGIVEGIPNSILATLNKQTLNSIQDKFEYEGVINTFIKYNLKAMKSEVSHVDDEDSKDSVTHFQILGFVKFEKNDPILLESSYLMNPKIFQEEQKGDKEVRKFFDHASENQGKVFYNTIIKFNIEGGRRHQIRAHAAKVLGTPILMDMKYGYRRTAEELIEEMFFDIDLNGYSREDKVIIDGEEKKITQNFQEESQVEKHYLKALVDKEFHFLHSNKLEFEVEKTKYEVKAGYPVYMRYYLEKVFKEKYEQFEKNF